MAPPTWKLDPARGRDSESDEEETPAYEIDEASSLGEFFADAIADGTGQAHGGGAKSKYPRFRKIYWEEGRFNPQINHGHIATHSHDYLQKEGATAWSHTGHRWSLSSDVRFKEDAYIKTGPQKAANIPHVFETAHKVWGRERKINPYERAKVYSRPKDRCKPWVQMVRQLVS
jgi:hypothetical protein